MRTAALSKDYQASFSVSASRETAFSVLTTRIQEWWSPDFSGAGDKIDEKFTVRFNGSFMTMQIKELVPGKRIVWNCVDSFTNIEALTDKTELNDTTISWDISFENGFTKIDMMHDGLVPEAECYDIGAQEWNLCIYQSLVPFLSTENSFKV